MSNDFVLHPRLEAETFSVGQLSLCSVRLMNDSNYPWLIAVPKRANISDIHQLSSDDRAQLALESHILSTALMDQCQGFKMNVAALGNVVAQLHVHHIVRFENDVAWPAPVWGYTKANPYTESAARLLIDQLRLRLSKHSSQFTTC